MEKPEILRQELATTVWSIVRIRLAALRLLLVHILIICNFVVSQPHQTASRLCTLGGYAIASGRSGRTVLEQTLIEKTNTIKAFTALTHSQPVRPRWRLMLVQNIFVSPMSPLGQWTEFFFFLSGLTGTASRIGALSARRNSAQPSQRVC